MPRVRQAPTTRSYRAAVQAIMAAVQRRYRLNDVELADRLGCSASTVRNAKGEHTNLDAVTLANLEHRFGPGALDPFLALGGSRAAPLPDVLPDIDPVLDIVAALHRLIEAQHASSEHGYLISSQELLAILRELRDARIAFDTLIALAQPGLATAPKETQRWFHDTFDNRHGLTSPGDAGREPAVKVVADLPPMGFEEAAVELDAAQLAVRFGTTTAVVERWLRMINEALITDLDR